MLPRGWLTLWEGQPHAYHRLSAFEDDAQPFHRADRQKAALFACRSCQTLERMNPTTQVRWISQSFLLLLGLVLACTARASDSQHSAPDRVCPASVVRVIAADAKDFRDVCNGAQAAMAFLAAHGLRPTEPLVLEVTPVKPEEAGPTAVAGYLESRKRVFMLPYAEFRKQKTWFSVPIDRDMYRSIAAHEAAHAVAACCFAIPRPTMQAKEYVAYVAMFATMNTLLRARVLRALPGKGFASENQITAIFYMLDPMRFGAESYRHYMKSENGATFLQSVLTGQALTDQALPE